MRIDVLNEYRVTYLEDEKLRKGDWWPITGLSWLHLRHAFEEGIVWDVETR